MIRHSAALALCAIVAAGGLVGACTAHTEHAGPSRSVNSRGTRSAPSSPTTTAATTTAAGAPPTTARPATYGGVQLGRPGGPCKVARPTAWTALLRAGQLWSDSVLTHVPGVPMPETQSVLSEADAGTTATIQLRGATNRRTIATPRRPGGQGSMADASADAHHVAFVYSLSSGEQAQNHWDLYLWDRARPAATVVAHNPVDAQGNPLLGGWVHPVLTESALWWIQARSNAVGRTIHAFGSALMRYDFRTRTTKVVYSGLATSLVAYRGSILVTAVAAQPDPVGPNGNPPLHARAFDQATGRETAAPTEMTVGADQPDWFVSDGDLVVWNTTDGAIRGWRAGWGRSVTLIPPFSEWQTGVANKPQLDYPGYPRIVGHFLAWSATVTVVMDLRTNSFVQLTQHHGGMEASGSRLAFWQYVHDRPPAYGQGLEIGQWVLDLSRAPELPACGSIGQRVISR